MSKSVLQIGLLVLAVVVPEVGLPLLAVAAIEVGIAIAANVLLGPSTPKLPKTNPIDRLYATLEPTTPRKIWFGNTAGATDVRYQAFTGTKQEYLDQIIANASHQVQSQSELWLDNEKAWDSSGVASKFSGFLTVDVRAVGTAANGIPIDTNWTSTATLTGCAYIHPRFKLIGSDPTNNDSPFASGVTSRMTVRGKGALTYDPRLDSTVTGGSGSHRATDQTTWVWSDSASRNPALQLLWYLLGWKINGKLAVGMGLPSARIDLPSFITAANLCDESVTLNGGGTEPRYRSDGVLSEGDDRTAVIETLCATMNAVLRDAGGKLSLTVLHNDLATPVTPPGRSAFDEGDIVGPCKWNQTPDLSDTFNIVRGRRIDPSDTSLYQPVDFPEVGLTSPDGIDRIDTVDYPMVQSNGQAQRLAKQRLQRNQYQGKLSFTGGPSWWSVNVGDPIALSHAAYGWTAKLFRVAGQRIRRTGETDMVLIEENAAIYAWDSSEVPAVTAASPTVYNAAANHPLQSGMNTAAKTSVVIDPPADVIIKADSSGTAKDGELPRDFGLTASIGTSDVTTDGTWSRTVTSGVTCTIGAATGVLTITALTVAEAFVPITFSFNGITRTIDVHVVRQDDQATSSGGAAGDSPSQTTGFASFIGSTFSVVSNVLTYTIPSGKNSATVTVNLNARPISGSDGSWTVEMKVQRNISGTWTDVGTTFSGASDATTNPDTGLQVRTAATISGTRQSTSLVAGTQYQFRIVARLTSGTPDNNHSHTVGGSVSVTAP